ncbi:rhodanese-like domain-containing protein [Brachybacterium saurashtrense]|uniref:Rhodanese-like domain-containing protein n=1 Tax=Brachybacterium saurashtrense TaxID=556288 RepID=A0A345YQ04_9MICO|nr:rhodanese-like domain-containing protein [Brachybacterium saurashtrense]AXK46006.1 rhodanese-like domain-containing protein [Brachybacterium saurashtrense]RRR23745.1 rhodanese-like domain-containing protein [Brachybacterium saurashtrense]
MDVETVSPQEVPEGAHLIDVREQSEWDAGHAPAAQHLPASSLLENLEQLPEDDAALYIVCRTGGRSFQVSQWLNANGFEAINVGGGMDQWFESGLPIEADGDGEAFIL